jgi:peptidoglycan/LPS O-acetylase OafA/YrhL
MAENTSSAHLDYLDGWRGLAIGLVLVHHFFNFDVVNAGRLGVDLFFVLSGLLMARILFEQRTPIGRFYRRRIARIVPAYFLFLAIVLTGGAMVGLTVTLKETLSLATFMRTYVGGFIWNDPLPIGHIWSLNVEEHSYLLLSLVASIPFLSRWPASTLFALALTSFGAIALHHHFSNDPFGEYMLNTECAARLLLLSAAYRLAPKVRMPSWAPMVALTLAVACYTPIPIAAKGVLLPPFLLAFAVNHLEDAPRWFLMALRTRWLTWLGLVSYSVYLWQQPFHSAGFGPIGIAAAIVVGTASYYLYEQPVRTWLNGNWGAGTPAATPDTRHHA